jgi:ABC-type phosphate transport system substrate-binding protein
VKTITLPDGRALTQAVQNNRQSIAYLSWAPAHAIGASIIRIDDLYPSSETISKKQYLLSQELQLFSKRDTSDQVQRFLDYCIAQQTGQAIVKEMGWISIG